MIVASKQCIGTLIGLQQGLFIIPTNTDVKQQQLVNGKLILPHCAVTRSLSIAHSTADVTLQLQTLHTPPFYVYDIDTRLCEIRGPNDLQALLYLAQLYATTASAMPDVLTGITGTESALKLLQSGRCSQSQPLSAAAITVLSEISKLSPIRKYYPTHLTQQQDITWPTSLPTCAAVDAYVILISHMIKRSSKLQVLFPASVVSAESTAMISAIDKHSTAPLTISAYWSDKARRGSEASSQLAASIEQQLPKQTARYSVCSMIVMPLQVQHLH
jgi:hypothetical protein